MSPRGTLIFCARCSAGGAGLQFGQDPAPYLPHGGERFRILFDVPGAVSPSDHMTGELDADEIEDVPELLN